MLSSIVSMLLFIWMMWDVTCDLREASAARRDDPEQYGLELVILARMNVVRELIRIVIGASALAAGYVAWERPAWAPDGLTIYLLLAGNIVFAIKAVFDRYIRARLRRYLASTIRDTQNGSREEPQHE